MMKKITLLFTLLTISLGYSQNLALGGTTDSSSGVSALAVDGDAGTRWESAFNDAEWWSVDLGASYDVGQVIITWEGAFGDEYTIDISTDNVNWTTIYTEAAGDGGTDDLSVSGTGRYIRYNGTSRGTVYGHSFYEFQVFEAVDPVTDATLSNLQVDTVVIDGFSSAVEDYTYSVSAGTVVVPTVAATPTQGTANAVVTPAGSIPGSTTIVVTAQDGITTKTYTVSFDFEVVLPFDFSNANQLFSAGGSTTSLTTDPDDGGNDVMQIDGGSGSWDNVYFNFDTPVDLSDDDKHIITFRIRPAADYGTRTHLLKFETPGATEKAFTTTGTGWQEMSVELPDGSGSYSTMFIFTDAGATDTGVYLIDDISAPSAVVAGTDATLSDLKVDTVTIGDFDSATEDYIYVVSEGTVTVPTVTATTTDIAANAVVTPASGIPGVTTVVVTAGNGIDTKTYNISFDYPVAMPLDFNGTLHGVTGDGAVVSNGPGNDVLQIEGGANNAWDSAVINFTTPIDLNDDDNNTLRFTIQSTTAGPGEIHQHGVSFQGGGGSLEANFQTTGTNVLNVELNFNDMVGSRERLHFFTDTGDLGGIAATPNVNGTDTSALSGTYIIDNISLGATVLSVDDFEKRSFRVFPNPTNDNWTIKTQDFNISSIKVFDVLGKTVMSFSPNNNETVIDGSSLKAGLYFAQIHTDKGVNSIKLVKN